MVKTYKKSLILSSLIHVAAAILAGYYHQPHTALLQPMELIEINLPPTAIASDPVIAYTASDLSTALPITGSTALSASAAAVGSSERKKTFSDIASRSNPISGNPLDSQPSSNPASGTVSTGSPAIQNIITAANSSAEQTPRILSQTKPIYPRQARRNRQQGSVLVKATIGESGIPTDIGILVSSGSSLLDQAAINAVRQWTFEPAKNTLTGAVIVCTTQIPITFEIN